MTQQIDGLTRQFAGQLIILMNQPNFGMSQPTSRLNQPGFQVNQPGWRQIEVAARRTIIAHGFNRGLNDQNETSPGGTAEPAPSVRHICSFTFRRNHHLRRSDIVWWRAEDAAPDGAWKMLGVRFYKDVAPDGAGSRAQLRRNAGQPDDFFLIKFLAGAKSKS